VVTPHPTHHHHQQQQQQRDEPYLLRYLQESGGAPAEDGAAKQKDDSAPPAVEKPNKKKNQLQIIIDLTQRGGKKKITVVKNLDAFGIDNKEASKYLKKKLACGCGTSQGNEGKEELEIQGTFQVKAAELLLKEYKELKETDFIITVSKKKLSYQDAVEALKD